MVRIGLGNAETCFDKIGHICALYLKKGKMAMQTPVLFLVFNRPQTTEKVFEAIRRAAPKKLYVAADAPREGRNEEQLCAQVRAMATNVDWDCEVKTLFQTTNKGLRVATIEAFNWVFEHEERAFLIEDDTLPSDDFFPFAEELLERYAHDERVAGIGGCNHNFPTGVEHYDYFFCHYIATWGWATWRRSWTRLGLYEKHRSEVMGANGTFDAIFYDKNENIEGRNNIKLMEAGKVNTWDFGWQLDMQLQGGVFAIPCENMVVNLGFGAGATNTPDANHIFSNLKFGKTQFPLRHPEYLVKSRLYEDSKMYKNQRIDELSTYKELLKYLYQKTRKKILGISNIPKV